MYLWRWKWYLWIYLKVVSYFRLKCFLLKGLLNYIFFNSCLCFHYFLITWYKFILKLFFLKKKKLFIFLVIFVNIYKLNIFICVLINWSNFKNFEPPPFTSFLNGLGLKNMMEIEMFFVWDVGIRDMAPKSDSKIVSDAPLDLCTLHMIVSNFLICVVHKLQRSTLVSHVSGRAIDLHKK